MTDCVQALFLQFVAQCELKIEPYVRYFTEIACVNTLSMRTRLYSDIDILQAFPKHLPDCCV